MVWVADDLAAWLVSVLADAGRKRLTQWALGTDQERALRQAATAAVGSTADELCRADSDSAEHLALVIGQVFGEPMRGTPLPIRATLLETLQSGITEQLAPLDDPGLTGVGTSSADLLGISAGALARTLTSNLVREIAVRGSRGGPLAALAAQLNHDLTHLQGQRLEGMIGELGRDLRDALGRLTVAPDPTAIGRLISELTDPFELEVHRSIEASEHAGGSALSDLPAYIRREHDARVAGVAARAVGGHSGIAMLVGGSSTGKTRACWQAVHALPEGWRLWHPIYPDRAPAFIAGLARVGPRTVIWLNDAQFYLLTGDNASGEQVAAGLRELLRDARRAPILVLGTIWPEYWHRLTAPVPSSREDVHPQARVLLAGAGIEVPDAFSSTALASLEEAAGADPRLAEAARNAADGQITQFLAGVPLLVERYRTAPPHARALIHAAMDARNFGHAQALPAGMLEAAAPGYLSDEQWDLLTDDWNDQGLAYTTAPCNGVRGPLARIRLRPPAGSTAVSGTRDGRDGWPGRLYRLADYLEQLGRRERSGQQPPEELLESLHAYADRASLPVIATQASSKGLDKHAARFWKQAVAAGDTWSAVELLRLINMADPRNAAAAGRWCAERASFADASSVAGLVDALREFRAWDALTALFRREPAAHADLSDPAAAARLLESLHRIREQPDVPPLFAPGDPGSAPGDPPAEVQRMAADAMAGLLARDPFATSRFADPGALARVLRLLQRICASGTLGELLARDPAAHADLTGPGAVADLLSALLDAGAVSMATAIATRAAGEISLSGEDLSHRADVRRFRETLDRTGSAEAASNLRANLGGRLAHDDLTSAGDVASLLEILADMRAQDVIALFLTRNPASSVQLTDASEVTRLLGALYEVGATDAITALLTRDLAAHVDLSSDFHVANLLSMLRQIGAADQARSLAARAVREYPDQPGEFRAGSYLLEAVHAIGAKEAVADLSARIGAPAHQDDFPLLSFPGHRRKSASRYPWNWRDITEPGEES